MPGGNPIGFRWLPHLVGAGTDPVATVYRLSLDSHMRHATLTHDVLDFHGDLPELMI